MVGRARRSGRRLRARRPRRAAPAPAAVELAVDLDPQRLEGALGRVAAGAPRRCRNGLARSRSTSRALVAEGRPLPLPDDRGRDPAGEPLLSVLAQHPRQVGRRIGVEDVGGGRSAGRVHPHVQRRVLRVGETAIGPGRAAGRTRRGRTGHRGPALQREPASTVGQLVVDGMDDCRTRSPNGASRCASARQRLGIAVETDQPDLWASSQQGLGVAAETEGRVDDDRARPACSAGASRSTTRSSRTGTCAAPRHGSDRRARRTPVPASRTSVPCTVSTPRLSADRCCAVLLPGSYGQVPARSPTVRRPWHRGRCARRDDAGRRPRRTAVGTSGRRGQKMPGSTSSDTSANSGSFSAW